MTSTVNCPYPTFVAVCTELIIGVLLALIINRERFTNRTA
jgi:hypothetical protein